MFRVIPAAAASTGSGRSGDNFRGMRIGTGFLPQLIDPGLVGALA